MSTAACLRIDFYIARRPALSVFITCRFLNPFHVEKGTIGCCKRYSRDRVSSQTEHFSGTFQRVARAYGLEFSC